MTLIVGISFFFFFPAALINIYIEFTSKMSQVTLTAAKALEVSAMYICERTEHKEITGGIYNIQENDSCENSCMAYSFHDSSFKQSMFSLRSSLGSKWHCSAEGRGRKAGEPKAWKVLRLDAGVLNQ